MTRLALTALASFYCGVAWGIRTIDHITGTIRQ
jgi:hypothetical protein